MISMSNVLVKWPKLWVLSDPIGSEIHVTNAIFTHMNGWIFLMVNVGKYTWIFLLCVKFVPKSHPKNVAKGRNFTYLEDPGIPYMDPVGMRLHPDMGRISP